jgi:hypothetical protein
VVTVDDQLREVSLMTRTSDKARSIVISKVENWSVDHIQLAHKITSEMHLTETVMDVLTSHNEVNFLSNRAAVTVRGRTVLQGICSLGDQLVYGLHNKICRKKGQTFSSVIPISACSTLHGFN